MNSSVILVALLMLVAKRCHDMGLPGSFLVVLLVPGIQIVWLAALFLVPGSAGPNPYGLKPIFRTD